MQEMNGKATTLASREVELLLNIKVDTDIEDKTAEGGMEIAYRPQQGNTKKWMILSSFLCVLCITLFVGLCGSIIIYHTNLYTVQNNGSERRCKDKGKVSHIYVSSILLIIKYYF